MPQFSKTLRSNEIFASIANMIISQEVAADNIKGTNARLLNEARVDVGLYGDQKLFYATDALHAKVWNPNDTNVLETHRPEDPKCQAIVIDKFFQIPLTVDSYLSKRAWGTEGAFNSFNSVLLGWIRDTKNIHDSTTYNAFIGTEESTKGKQNLTIDLQGKTDEEEAKAIAEYIANLMTDMADPNREFNDYGFMRSYDESEIKIVWNSAYVNKIRKVDLPTIFHSEGLMGDKFAQYVLPAKYFGKRVSGSVKAEQMATLRRLDECPEESKIGGGGSTAIQKAAFPGELAFKEIAPGFTASFGENVYYSQDDKIICKIYTKLPPFMSSMEVGTSFFNAKSLSENHYTTWGYNTLEHLSDRPCITIRAK